MGETPPEEGGVFATVTRVLHTLRNVAEVRLELFLCELKEERIRRCEMLLLAAIAVICALMTLILVTFTVVVIFWDTHRVLVLSLVTLVYAVTTAVACLKLRSRLQRWRPFSATLEEIKKDCACFKKPN